MFAALSRSAPRIVARAAVQPVGEAPARSMATLKEVQNRIKTVKNIGQITLSMKTVASTKQKKAQDRFEIAQKWFHTVNDPVYTKDATETELTPAGPGERHRIIAITADRGLCGSINNGIIRLAKRVASESKGDLNMAPVGLKAKGGLSREFAGQTSISVCSLGGKKGVMISDVVPFVDKLLEDDFDQLTLLSNEFESLISFNTKSTDLLSPNKLAELDLNAYEIESDDKAGTLQNLYEYHLGAFLFTSIIENEAAEMAARMTSMDNASKNSQDMIKKLTVLYNRRRQAVITTELAELISGAAAVENASDD
mmetsp:Transcript_12951/g.33051  ORF Transcript_12951/g.33051 Transcript_12951/m.33051 type:complete len:311 (-) Transcript_12951:46-978(-)|eukprot:CAMPEP_0177637864 /NCGR_PEP_ID=MMETSP0447-20121125/5191_1 /TAXON_ID=0 /ORGANISM="Stygamoeba regulata, Strain BSH-02190019" /LENGTH=310 /DNA_ID=CAMNT_0019139805 /DNA_START=219 /DNA_END=1151 /DNA_ORIENTATION=-